MLPRRDMTVRAFSPLKGHPDQRVVGAASPAPELLDAHGVPDQLAKNATHDKRICAFLAREPLATIENAGFLRAIAKWHAGLLFDREQRLHDTLSPADGIDDYAIGLLDFGPEGHQPIFKVECCHCATSKMTTGHHLWWVMACSIAPTVDVATSPAAPPRGERKGEERKHRGGASN
jgi:hypothetical protein